MFGASKEKKELAQLSARYRIEQLLIQGFQKGEFPLHFESLPGDIQTIGQRLQALKIEVIEFDTSGYYQSKPVVIKCEQRQHSTSYTIS